MRVKSNTLIDSGQIEACFGDGSDRQQLVRMGKGGAPGDLKRDEIWLNRFAGKLASPLPASGARERTFIAVTI
jgi:hypothetical protein